NVVIWHEYVLFIVLGTGVLFTIWSGVGQYRALTHGVQVIRGKYDDKDDPGAINHFQALSAALSATVGLGNIAGVGVAVALGGPGAVFWMWMVGIFGMALKMTEVTQSMLFRNTEDPDNPHGGPMFVASKGFKKWGLGGLGKAIGGIFVATLLVSTITGGNMFQSWNVSEVTRKDFGIPVEATGIIMAVLVGLVIIGGIKRIGAVAGRIVPLMCLIYVVAALYVIVRNIEEVPAMFALIFESAFSPAEASGAFVGGTFGYALLWGMKRALFSSEAGQGTSPIAHSAAKTHEPVREGVVAGIEPFIDTIVVCTITALVILTTGAWNRGGEANYETGTQNIVAVPNVAEGETPEWTLDNRLLPNRTATARTTEGPWSETSRTQVFMIVEVDDVDEDSGTQLRRLNGAATYNAERELHEIEWQKIANPTPPRLQGNSVYVEYPGASLTSHAFNLVTPGLGKWLVVLASWLFALSTMISWSYYGEQGVVFLLGEKAVFPYKIVYCLLILIASLGFIETDAQLDSLTALGTGVMLWANIPIMLIFGAIAMKAYHSYFKKFDKGEFKGEEHEAQSAVDIVEGKDVE
ncbi:MAG: amino acid carrier protein, partial [Planctomycetota bacterium]